MYSCTLLLTSALDGGEWSTPCPGRFTPRERPGTHSTGGWAGLWTGAEKLLPHPPGFDPRTVQPVASRYTD
jgi:rRNA maturation protein Nop10